MASSLVLMTASLLWFNGRRHWRQWPGAFYQCQGLKVRGQAKIQATKFPNPTHKFSSQILISQGIFGHLTEAFTYLPVYTLCSQAMGRANPLISIRRVCEGLCGRMGDCAGLPHYSGHQPLLHFDGMIKALFQALRSKHARTTALTFWWKHFILQRNATLQEGANRI